jgi:hypothetical protein
MAPETVVLACQRCTRLKIKCSKTLPECTQCVRTGTLCQAIVRARRSRGRNGGRPSRKAEELLERLERVEELLQSQQAVSAGNSSTLPSRNADATSQLALPTSIYASSGAPSGHNEPRIERPEVPLGYTLFSQLSDELLGIREILEDTSHETPATATSNDLVTLWTSSSTDNLDILFNGSSFHDSQILVPDPAETTYLLQTFLERVQPVVRAVHYPTLAEDIKSNLIGLGEWPTDRLAAALFAASLYASVASLREVECKERLGLLRNQALGLWRQRVEQLMASSNFLVSERLEAVQGLVFYLVGTSCKISSHKL